MKGKIRTNFAAEFAFSLSLLFWLFLILSNSKILIYPLINRVNYVHPFSQSIVSPNWDPFIIIVLVSLAFALHNDGKIRYRSVISALIIAIAAASMQYPQIVVIFSYVVLPFLASLMIAKKIVNHSDLIPCFSLKRILFFFLLIWSLIEGLSIFSWTNFLIHGDMAYDEKVWYFAKLSSDLFYSMASLNSYILVILAFGFLAKPISNYVTILIRKTIPKTRIKSASLNDQESPRSKFSIFLLIFAFIVSLIIPLLLQSSSINPDSEELGVDIPFYREWLGGSITKPFSEVIRDIWNVNGGDRPLSLFIIYLLTQLTGGNLSLVLTNLPLLLSPVFVLSTFYFMKRQSKLILTSTAVFFASVSHQVLVGIYAGFYSNWMALSTLMLTLAFLMKALDKTNKKNVLLFASLFVATYFMHVFTWIYLVVVIIAFLILHTLHIKEKSFLRSRFVVYTSLVVISVLVFDVLKGDLLGGDGGLALSANVATSGFPYGGSVSLQEAELRWNNLFHNFTIYLGGLLSNAVMFALALFWLLVGKHDTPFERLILASMFAVSVGLLFSSYDIQSRLIYNVPIFLGAGLAFKFAQKINVYHLISIYSFVLLFMINNALRSVSNLHLILPK